MPSAQPAIFNNLSYYNYPFKEFGLIQRVTKQIKGKNRLLSNITVDFYADVSIDYLRTYKDFRFQKNQENQRFSLAFVSFSVLPRLSALVETYKYLLLPHFNSCFHSSVLGKNACHANQNTITEGTCSPCGPVILGYLLSAS